MLVDDRQAYRTLTDRFGNAGRLYAVKLTLFWDSQTYMPKGGAWSRGEQMAAIDAARHDLIAAPDAADLFAAAENRADALDPIERANLLEMRRIWLHESAVLRALTVSKARAVAKTQAAWAAARQENEFGVFAQAYSELFPLIQEIASAKADVLGLEPYDALMDEADPGLTTAIVDPIFDDLSSELPILLAEVLERQSSWPAPIPFSGNFSTELQKTLAYQLARVVGLTTDHARIDVAPHPFTLIGSPGDTRITVRLNPNDIRLCLMATLHEAGHALYETNLPKEHAFLPVSAPRGATVHESQALMLEMQAARSREFLTWLAPQLQRAFGGDPARWSVDNVVKHYRRLDAGHIRIESDEISYPLHVILRYRIERALMGGDLVIADLPGAWSELSQSLLGRRPPNDALGCLQDFHWAVGLFGYFPNYALGACFAAQLFEAAVDDDPAILSDLSHGDFEAYKAWVAPRIHAPASERPFKELVVRATGAHLSAKSLKNHLRRRYLEK